MAFSLALKYQEDLKTCIKLDETKFHKKIRTCTWIHKSNLLYFYSKTLADYVIKTLLEGVLERGETVVVDCGMPETQHCPHLF